MSGQTSYWDCICLSHVGVYTAVLVGFFFYKEVVQNSKHVRLDSYLLTGEIAMHLLYGFDALIGQDALKTG